MKINMSEGTVASVNQVQSQSSFNQGQSQASIVFALAPGRAPTSVIDYYTTSGSKIWKNYTSKLSDVLYEYTSNLLRTILDLFKNRLVAYDWETILCIPNDVINPLRSTTNHLNYYVNDSMHCDRFRQFYNTFTNDQTRVAHKYFARCTCLANFLSKEVLVKVTLHAEDYTVQVINIGLQLLKVIIRES